MSASPLLPQAATNGSARQAQLARRQSGYRYMPPDKNELDPVCIAEAWPWTKELFGLSWALRFVPGYLAAYANKFIKSLRFGFQRATFRFDKMKAYRQLFTGDLPEFVEQAESDQLFAYRRIAGPNALSLQNALTLRIEDPFGALCERIALTDADPQGRTPLVRVDAMLSKGLDRKVSLADEVKAGRVFFCDFSPIQHALRPEGRPRDSRWRAKYLPAPIGVFVEAPGFYADTDLVAVAIQIDQKQPERPGKPPEHNPVYTPDQGWGWKIAKTYFEVADENFHATCGHGYRTHLFMDPFCMATPRQLSEQHPVYVLLRPHTRYTLAVNKSVYQNFVDRKQAFFEFYSANLEELRDVVIGSYEDKTLLELEFETEMESRGVAHSPKHYPYRDDARRWLQPIRDFVDEYLSAFYGTDADVREDSELQNWADELVQPGAGGVRGLVPGDLLDTREKLVNLLTQVIFVAGPGHAAQHFAEMHFYRYPPAFAAAAYAPPPWHDDGCHEARFRDTLPPIGPATLKFTYDTFANFQYDTFGRYAGYPLAKVPAAREPIRKLNEALKEVEKAIFADCETRPKAMPYRFLLPSNVPNSISF